MHRSIPLLSFWLLCMPLAAAEPTIIDVGGPRKATAAITEIEEHYEIEVRLIPVRCFDPGMNRRLSQDKARAYAIEALIRHLGREKKQTATIRRIEIVESNVIESRFVLRVRIPRTGVTLTTASKSQPASNSSSTTTSRSPLKAKDDFQQTLAVLAETMATELPQFTNNVDEFYEAVSDAEELGVARLAALRNDIKTDRWLLSTEREELLLAVAMEEERLLKMLKERVERVQVEAAEEE